MKDGIYNCKGLAVDWYGKNLYWTDEEGGTISIVSLRDFSKKRTLFRDQQSNPRSIVLDPKAGYVIIRSESHILLRPANLVFP